MRLLLHCCCGPCSILVAEHFRDLGGDVTGWFYNPNIHPTEERLRRQQTMTEASRAIALPMLEPGPAMGLDDFLLHLAREPGRRCAACWRVRLAATARRAAEGGFDAFSSTLLISPYQEAEEVGRIGREVGEQAGVAFRFADLRARYQESCDRARELGLYRQNFCGCVFSALERSERRARRAVARGLRE